MTADHQLLELHMSDDGLLRLGRDAGLQRPAGVGDDGVDSQPGAEREDGAHDVHGSHRRRERVRDQGRVPVDRLYLAQEHENEDEIHCESNPRYLSLSLSLSRVSSTSQRFQFFYEFFFLFGGLFSLFKIVPTFPRWETLRSCFSLFVMNRKIRVGTPRTSDEGMNE